MNIIIVGAGDIGFHLCSKLIQDNNNCTIIELNSAIAQKAREHLDCNVIEGSATSIKILQRASIDTTDVFVAVTQNDELNVVACMIAKKHGVATTIARIRNQEYISIKSTDYGVDLIVHPEKEAADAIVHLVRQSSATDYYELEGGQIKIVGIRLGEEFEYFNVSLFQLGRLMTHLSLRILAIKRNERTIIPKGDDEIIRGDQIYIICSNNHLKDALNFFGRQNAKVDKVMILGGGLIGQYVASELEKKISVRIIESDERKANLLADNLNKSLVIHGNGTDIELLLSEDLTDMDEFIACSGDDETNIITSMLASQMNIKRRITMVKNIDYLKMSSAVGIDSIICKPLITVNTILKFIRRKKNASFASIYGLDAVLMELEVKQNSKITKKSLSEIHLPENLIFGAVFKRNNKFEIPTGSTQIESGDKVVVFHLPGNIKEIEKLF
ncbi:Trk system potassium transporter TrkA [Candidatus Kapaibacterium sp.]